MISLKSTTMYTTCETGSIELDEAWIVNFAIYHGYTMEQIAELSATELATELADEIWDVVEQDDTLPIKVATQIINGDHVGFDIKEVE